jgi:hypothetical protein
MSRPSLLYGVRPIGPGPRIDAERAAPYDWLLDASNSWPVAPVEGALLHWQHYSAGQPNGRRLTLIGQRVSALVGLTVSARQTCFISAVASGYQHWHLLWQSAPDRWLEEPLAALDRQCQEITGVDPRHRHRLIGMISDLQRLPSLEDPSFYHLPSGRPYPPVWWLREHHQWPIQPGILPENRVRQAT